MPPLEWKHEDGLIRTHEAALATLKQMQVDFMSRYDHDRVECADRYRNDREESKMRHKAIADRFDAQDKILRDLNEFASTARPFYRSTMRIAGLIVLGALGIIWTMVWTHVSGGK